MIAFNYSGYIDVFVFFLFLIFDFLIKNKKI